MSAVTAPVSNFLATGINLYPLPLSPGFAQLDWSNANGVSSNVSPFTRQTQVQLWPGADYWACTVTMPPLSKAQAADWTGMLDQLCGITHAFQLGDQLYTGPTAPVGAIGSAPVVNGTQSTNNAPGTYALSTKGWLPNAFRVLSRGDKLQIGYRLYKVTANANADANGDAVLSVWPSLRETPADGAAIDISNPVGIFRLAQDYTQSGSYTGITHLSFRAMEVR